MNKGGVSSFQNGRGKCPRELSICCLVSAVRSLRDSTEWPKKLCIFHRTIFLELLKIKLSGFHQNVPRVSGNKDYIAILCSCYIFFAS